MLRAIVRLIDCDYTAAHAAFVARDAAAFAAAIAPLGVDLSLATAVDYLSRKLANPDDAIRFMLIVIVEALTVEAGVGMRSQGNHRAVTIARRKSPTSLVFAAVPKTNDHRYGWAEIPRWNQELSRNRNMLDKWERSADLLTIAIREARADDAAATTEAELVAAVLANPGDDAPRLVLADHWMELGDPRGELIRLQCALETTLEPEDGPLHAAIVRVSNRCHAAFAHDLGTSMIYFRRGFLHEVHLTVAALAKYRAKLFAANPVRVLHVEVPHHKGLVKLAKLARDLPACVDKITIDGWRVEKHDFALDDPELAPLWERGGTIGFKDIRATEAGWRAVFRAMRQHRLEMQCPQIYLPVLAEAGSGPALTEFDLKDGDFSEELRDKDTALRTLGARPGLAHARLSFIQDNVQEAGVAALFEHAALESFGDRHHQDGAASTRALARSPRARSLRQLELSVTVETVDMLAAALPNVEEIGLFVEPDAGTAVLDRVATGLRGWPSVRWIVPYFEKVPRALATAVPGVQFIKRTYEGTRYLAKVEP